MPTAQLELVRGTVDLLILRILSRGPMHGYAVAALIRERSDGDLLVEEGALYPALHRLETRGFVEAEWGITATNRRARYYTLTTAGRRHLRSETSTWHRYVAAVARVLAPEGGR